MSDGRKLAGGILAVLVVGAIAFAGLYMMVRKAATKLETAQQSAPAPEAAGGTGEIPAPTMPADEAAQGEDSGAAPGAGEEAAESAAPPAEVSELDMSLDEPTLQKFLEVRRKIFEVYGPNQRRATHLFLNWQNLKVSGRRALQKSQFIVRMLDAKKEGLAATGLSAQEYDRVAHVVYEKWWTATAAHVDVGEKVSEARKAIAAADSQLSQPDLTQGQRSMLELEKQVQELEIARLEWSRSYPARQLLAQIPEATTRLCDKYAKEIDAVAMKEGDILTF